MNFYSVRLRSSFFFLSLQEGTAFGDPGRPIQTDSTASGISRQRETETEREKERTQRVSSSLSLSEKRSRSFRSALSKRFHCIAYVHKPLEYDTKIFHTTISLRFHDIVRVQ